MRIPAHLRLSGLGVHCFRIVPFCATPFLTAASGLQKSNLDPLGCRRLPFDCGSRVLSRPFGGGLNTWEPAASLAYTRFCKQVGTRPAELRRCGRSDDSARTFPAVIERDSGASSALTIVMSSEWIRPFNTATAFNMLSAWMEMVARRHRSKYHF